MHLFSKAFPSHPPPSKPLIYRGLQVFCNPPANLAFLAGHDFCLARVLPSASGFRTTRPLFLKTQEVRVLLDASHVFTDVRRTRAPTGLRRKAWGFNPRTPGHAPRGALKGRRVSPRKNEFHPLDTMSASGFKG